MKSFSYTVSLVLLAALCFAPVAYGQSEEDAPAQPEQETTKRGQTGMKFLKMSVDARAAGMASALTAMEASSSAMFYNPAGMARMSNSLHVGVAQAQFVADITYNAASIAFRPANGRFGVFGLSVLSVDYGDFLGTIRADNEAGFINTGTFSPSAMAVGFGYANALSDRFAVGGNVKYARQDLSSSVMGFEEGGGFDDSGSYITQENVQGTLAFDLGVLYKTGFRSLNFAMSARNFSREVTYERENFELPLTFSIGVSMDMMDLTSMNQDIHSFVVAVDAERPRDYYEHLKVGGEYTFMDILSLRGGYSFPTDDQGMSLGVGLQHEFGGIGVGADYAFTQYDILENVHRIALQIAL